MKLGRIRNGNSLFRHCIYPISFNKKSASFAHEKMFYLQSQPDGALHGSLAWERYVPAPEYIHGYGCRLAAGINFRKRQAGKFSEKSRHYYCGAYQLTARTVRSLAITAGLDGVAAADIVHLIEEGEIAHADLRIFLKPGVHEEGTKTAIVDRLWNACSGPLRHTCDYDRDIHAHQSSNLRTAPVGEYRDAWPSLFRLFRVIRFRFFRWLWLNSTNCEIYSWLWKFVSQD
jgi:hypothetical protein